MFSEKGDCHDLGNGKWNDTDFISFMGWVWNNDQLQKSKMLYHGHIVDFSPLKFTQVDCKTVYIKVDNQDLNLVTNLRFEKAMIPFLKTDYVKFKNKFNIKNWPSYETIVQNPYTIKDDIIRYDEIWQKEWIDQIDTEQVDYTINFKTIFGLDNLDLNKAVADITGQNVDFNLKDYITNYRNINRQKYPELKNYQ